MLVEVFFHHLYFLAFSIYHATLITLLLELYVFNLAKSISSLHIRIWNMILIESQAFFILHVTCLATSTLALEELETDTPSVASHYPRSHWNLSSHY